MRKIRERSLRLECLEDRTLLAVVAGGEESAAAVYAVDAEPMATAAVQLDTPTNVQAVCNSNNRVQVSWDAVPNASQYTVYSQKVGATNWKATVATGTSVTVSGLMATGAYAFKVVANGDGTNYTDSEESAVVKCYPHTSYSTVVTTLADIKETYTPSGDISFRQAVYFASMMDDTVTFAEGLAGTADLATFGQITLTGGLTIDGDNRITLTNTGTAVENRLFSVGVSDTGFDVFLRNLTFTGFSVTQTGEDYVYGRGGAIVIWNTRFNPANNNFINVTLDHCSVTDCFAADCGGFFYAYGGTIQSTNSTFSENVARYGGAIGILAGDAFLTDSVFTGNTVTGTTSAEGGALYLNTSYGSVIDNCEFSNNTASISSTNFFSDDSAIGGAIFLLNGESINIYDSQITNNTATCVGSGDGSSYCRIALGGGIYTQNVALRIYNSEITGNSAQYSLHNVGGGLYIAPSNREVFLYMTNISENFVGYKDYDVWAGGGAGNCPSQGGAIYAGGVFHMVNCTVLDNIIYGSRMNNQIAQMGGSAIFDDAGMVLYNTTIAGNRVLASSVAYTDHQTYAKCPDYSGILEYGSGTLISCVVLGNYYENTDTGIKTDSDIYSHAWMHSSNDMILNSCVYNPNAIDKDTSEDEYVSDEEAELADAWNFDIRANSIAVTDYEAFFNDYAAGDYTLASESVGIDAADMDVWASFGYEYDIRGEGYYRLINNVADIGAYEFQSAAPTFEVTIIDYTGDFDGEYHSISINGLEEGDVVSYSEDGINYSGTILSYANPGTYTVYVKVERSGYQDFTGSGTVTINEVFTKMQVAVIVSDGAASATEVAVLPESITTASVGQTVYAQVWILNADSSELGCTGGYIDLDYTSAIEAGSFTVSSIYASQATYCDSSVPGVISCLGGCAQAGVNDLAVIDWALLGTFTFTASEEGVAEISAALPTLNGSHIQGLNLARVGEGCFADNEIAFGSATFTVTGSGGQLAAPTIQTGIRGVYVSGGANRHQIVWSAVANASGYELSYTTGGGTWTSLETTETDAVVLGLTYGTDMTYRVRALGTGSYTDSDWSPSKTFNVCPMDINNDGDISGGDRALLSSAWLAEEGDDEYRIYCDINGDGDISNGDRVFISRNWLSEAGDADLTYPPALQADAVFAEFASADLDVDLSVF